MIRGCAKRARKFFLTLNKENIKDLKVKTLASVNDENLIKVNGKYLGLLFILIISFFGVVSYVKALTSFQPTYVSQ